MSQIARSARNPGAIWPHSAATAQNLRPAACGQSQRIARRKRLRPFGDPLQSIACRASATRLPLSLEADPSTPRPTGTPAWRIRATGAMPEARRQLEQGQCATPVAVLANRSISCASSFTQWACQTSPGPAQILGVLPRSAAEILQRIGYVLVVLGQMGVHHHALVPRQKGGIAHQLAADGKGRTGRDGHACHGARTRVVKAIYDANAVVQDAFFVLDEAVGRQPPVRFPDRHRPARGVKPQADLPGRRDRVIKPRAVGEEIEVIGGHRAARQRQFRQPACAETNMCSGVKRAQIG
jgi:hypothetical protein